MQSLPRTFQPRKIACISTSRADAGIYRPLLQALAASSDFEPVCMAGGTHLSAQIGGSIEELRALRGINVVTVDHHSTGDDAASVARSAGAAVGAFAEAIASHRPDLVFVLGDRAEMLAAALAATICTVPIAHLHGGDSTEGAYDDACRHAITKLAHLHFPAVREHAERIRSLGEEAARIHVVGALALDSLRYFEPEPVEQLSAALGLDFARPLCVVLFHPETLSQVAAKDQIDCVLSAVRGIEGNLLLIGTNADVGHGEIDGAMRRLASEYPGTRFVANLSQLRFWSCLAHARVLIGNSSAGIIEAASFALPVVNVGDRQRGRVRATNVIDAGFTPAELSRALGKASSPDFRAGLQSIANPYGDGRAAARVLEVLRTPIRADRLLRKGRPPR